MTSAKTTRFLAVFLLASVCRAESIPEAADKVLAAFRAKQDLKPLAARDRPDPWMVAHKLCLLGQFDAALAFARAAPRPDVEKLPAYVEARRTEPVSQNRLEQMRALQRTSREKRWEDALACKFEDQADVLSVRYLLGRGLSFKALGRVGDELKNLRKIVMRSERLGWWAEAAEAADAGFTVAHRAKGAAAARPFAVRLLALARRRNRPGDEVRCEVLIGNMDLERGRLEAAQARYEQAHARAVALKLPNKIGLALHALGRLAMQRDDGESALRYFEKAYELARKQLARGAQPAAQKARATASRLNIAATLSMLGRHDEALDIYRAILAAEPRPYNRAVALGNIGFIHSSRGAYPEACVAYKRAIPLMEKAFSTSAMANWQALPEFLLKLSAAQLWIDRSAAIDSARRARTLSEQRGDRSGVASATGLLGAIHLQYGNYAEALRHLLRALEMDPQGEGTGARLANLSLLYLRTGNSDTALRTARRAQALARTRGDRSSEIMALKNAGVALLERDVAAARKDLEQALAMARKFVPKLVVTLSSDLARAHEAAGEDDRARAILLDVLKHQKKSGDLYAQSAVLQRLGAIAYRAKRLDDAERYARAGLDLARKVGDPPGEILCLSDLGVAAAARGDWAGCLRFSREAVERVPLVVGGLAEEEGASARGVWSTVYTNGLAASLETGDAESAVMFVEEGRAGTLREALRLRQTAWADRIPKPLRDAEAQWRSRERVAWQRYRLALKTGKQVEQRWKEVQAAQNGLTAAVRRILREAKAQAGLVCGQADSLEEIQGALRENEVLVLYAAATEKMAALVLTRDSARQVEIGLIREVMAAARAFRSAVDRPDQRGMRRPPHEQLPFLARKLRGLLIDPLKLPKGARLLVSPHGALAYIPFGVLAQRETVYVPSGTTYRFLRSMEKLRGNRVLAVGNPDYSVKPDQAASALWTGGELAPLPESGAEAKAVGDLVLLSKDATIRKLREQLSQDQRWRAVHFACHGLVDPARPSLSALALTPSASDDGFLRCLDIYRMKIPADLVVLSACETGKGRIYKAEGVIGWTRAFLFAGAPRVMVSLWKVDDHATRALMEKFYALWKDSKMPAATALKKAQEHVASQPQWKHPYFWAAWQLWGLGE